MKITEIFGVVASFDLPEGWESDEPMEIGSRKTHVFHPIENREILFCQHLREQHLSRPASENFERVLYAPFHDLDENEIADLAEVIEGLSNQNVFTISEASTDYLNDRRIIRILGDWKDRNLTMLSCFVDKVGNGQKVQNIYFSAPREQFGDLVETADLIFRSIKWVTN